MKVYINDFALSVISIDVDFNLDLVEIEIDINKRFEMSYFQDEINSKEYIKFSVRFFSELYNKFVVTEVKNIYHNIEINHSSVKRMQYKLESFRELD